MSNNRYSIFSVLRETLRGHTGWGPAWRDAEPKSDYDIVIIGGGGHGLATAYYLAKMFGLKNIAVVKKAGSAAVTSAAIRRLSGRTTCCPATSRSTSRP